MIRQRNLDKYSEVGIERIATGLLTGTATDVVLARIFHGVEKVELLEYGICGQITSGTLNLDVYSYTDGQNPLTSSKGTVIADGSADGVTLTNGVDTLKSYWDDPIEVAGDPDSNGVNRVGLKLQTDVSSPISPEYYCYMVVRVYRSADV